MDDFLKERVFITKEKLKKSIDYYIIDPLTGLYNATFLTEYLNNELSLISKQSKKPHLMLIIIKIDDILDINIKYSNEIGNETIKNLSYIIKEMDQDKKICFKGSGPNFFLLTYDLKEDIHDFIRNIQNKVKNSEIFIDSITISCASVSLDEFDLKEEPHALSAKIINTGLKRINYTMELGKSSYIDKNTNIEKKFFGNILIAESDSLILNILGSYFQEQGYNVTKAKDGLQALTFAKEKKYDALIIDRYTKKIDGLTLKKHINESSKNMNSTFLLTVQNKSVDIINKANNVSIDYVFDKPVILEEILGVIKRDVYRKLCSL